MRESVQKQSQPERNSSATTASSTPVTPAHPLIDLQRVAGNRAVAGAMVELPLRGMVHPVAAAMADPGVRFRLPSFQELWKVYQGKTLKIPEAVIKDRVAQLLGRMQLEGRLKSTEPVAAIIAKIFPGPGLLDEVQFNKVVDVNDRSKIYKSVLEADTKIKPADKPKLSTAFEDAAKLVATVEADDKGLKEVFGGEAAAAKANYATTKKVLEDLAQNMDPVFTDYNLDDPQIGLGGFASHAKKKMHLLLGVVQVIDVNKTKAMLIHEASHFANASVDDHVYYGRPGFFERDEATKVLNAAHYEELPRREMKTSSFDGMTFTPGQMPTGKPQTREEKIRAAAEDHLRKAWDAAGDVHMLIRAVRREYLKGDAKPFKDNEALILEISKLMDLTVHEQAAGKALVTTLDVTLAESIARGINLTRPKVTTVAFPSAADMLAMTDTEIQDKVVADAVAQYGQLLKDAARDKALVDWCAAHYRSLPDLD